MERRTRAGRRKVDIRVRQREKAILGYLDVNRKASVSELSEALSVSEVTIRRDLIRMDEEKKITRFHGGARLFEMKPGESANTEFLQKCASMAEEKRRIGLYACRFIHDGDIIFMNSGTTVIQFFQQLDKSDITVVTNNAAALACRHRPGIELLMLGGIYNERTRSVGGEITTNCLNGFYSSCTILGVNALDTVEGMTTSVYQESTINNAMISHTRGKVIVLADSSKMGKISRYVSSPLSMIDVIITDSGCPQEFITNFKHQNIEVVVV